MLKLTTAQKEALKMIRNGFKRRPARTAKVLEKKGLVTVQSEIVGFRGSAPKWEHISTLTPEGLRIADVLLAEHIQEHGKAWEYPRGL